MADQHDQELVQKPDVIQQNPLEAPPEYSTEPPDFSVLRLDHLDNHSPCANCGFSGAGTGTGNRNGNSLKRPSPISVNSQQPKPKKLSLDDPITTTPFPLLRRCVSDAFHLPPPVQSPPAYAPASGISSNSSPKTALSPESVTPCSATALPPRPPPLRRNNSAPIPSPTKSLSRTSSSNQFDSKTDNSKKRTKIRNCLKEMSMWMEELMGVEQSQDQSESLVDEENGGVETTTYHDNDKENANITKTSEAEFEESLSVERDGNWLNIHFKCHCGKGYHFLLADGSCFYKLM
ncbi:hypothetical protein L484_021988 [Morus notabilis]|uniref:Uncharacterized protein n=1 Tax=Morus notabilis TaxID=981085 RepID=W9QUZ6_9ROSA|nr:proline-, glutamic acid- and leucine-rich protein 1 [Morus notabilis]EXB42393.1 hypothetical protein L484_021988 [Morus notabilis]